MATQTDYTFTQEVNYPDTLTYDIQQSSISTALSFINTVGSGSEMTVTVWFKDVLSSEDVTTLNSVMAAYVNEPLSITPPTLSVNVTQVGGTEAQTDSGLLVIQPTTPVNSHTLQPLGLTKNRFNPNAWSAIITLSDQQTDTFNFTCSLSPDALNGFICTADFITRVPIVAATTSTVTVASGMGAELGTGEFVLCNPVNIDYVLPSALPLYELWGVYFNATGYGSDDFGALQVVDTTGEVSGGPPGTVLVTYDMVWISSLVKLGRLNTPDGTPGEIPGSCTIRIMYYNSQTASGQVDAYVDAIITVPN